MKCAVYCRYSSDKQNRLSIEDQLRVCREHSERQGWEVLDEHVYKDEALSAAGSDRPAFTQLIRAALSQPPPFDLILIDDTSRLSRNLADGLQTVAQLKFAGIRVVAVSQGIDTGSEQAEVLMTVHGLVDSLFLRELAKKTHRGMEGRVLRGLPAAGRCYGYRNTPEGPCIDRSEAAVVKRIFKLSAAGTSLKVIARILNRENVPGPKERKGRKSTGWGHTEIRGILHRDLYRGQITWNKTHFEKRPGTNKRVCRPNPPDQWRTVTAESLRIISDSLWQKVQERFAQVKERYGQDRPPGLLSRAAGSRYLLSGVLICGECGGRIAITSSGPQRHPRYGCPAHVRGTCKNGLTIRADILEENVLEGLQRAVLDPEVADYIFQRFSQQVRERLTEISDGLKALQTEKAELERQIGNLGRALEDGYSPALTLALAEKEKRLARLTDQILSAEPESLESNLASLKKWLREHTASLRKLFASDPAHAREELLKHTQAITLKPTEGRRYLVSGAWDLLGDPPEGPRLLRVIAGG